MMTNQSTHTPDTTTTKQSPDIDAMRRDIAILLAMVDDPRVICRVWKILLREVMR